MRPQVHIPMPLRCRDLRPLVLMTLGFWLLAFIIAHLLKP